MWLHKTGNYLELNRDSGSLLTSLSTTHPETVMNPIVEHLDLGRP